MNFKTCQFRLYLHRTTALWSSHSRLLTLHRFLKEMSVLSWHFLVMPKIVSHPSFSSELDNVFPMLSLQVLHFLTISSSLGSETRFSVHGAVQTSVSISCLGSMACGRRGFSPCAALTPVTASPAFILCSLGCGAACISLILLLPRQGYSLARANHHGGSLHRVFDTESTWLFTASNILF